MYNSAFLIFLEALTPVHVGTGREEGFHVDLSVQRDEFGFPTIWASSLKGALKANIDQNFRKYLGSEPEEGEIRPSYISILDAKLLLIPARTLDNVWIYISTPHLLGYLKTYLDIYNDIMNTQYNVNLSMLSRDKAISTKFSEKAFINELDIPVTKNTELLTNLGLKTLLPEDLGNYIEKQGLVIIPDANNQSLTIVRRSMMIQYRVRLKRTEKTVDTGPWSEEYLPMKTILVSLALCRNVQRENKDAKSLCEEFKNKLNNKKSIYVGGKETIGRGLVKLYIR